MPLKKCSACGQSHEPPRGKRCTRKEEEEAAPTPSMEEKILAKLEGLDDRLRQIEERSASQSQEQSEDEDDDQDGAAQPTVQNLRNDSSLQRMVEQRLRAMGVSARGDSDSEDEDRGSSKKGKRKAKSGRVKTAADFIKVEMEWPHFHVFRGASRKPAKYDEINLAEFVYGYLSIVLESEQSPAIGRRMLQHLRGLMMDTSEYSFEAARNCHAIVMQQLEQTRITWDDADKMVELRKTYAQRGHAAEATATANSGREHTRGALFCLKFQEGRCTFHDDHQTSRGMVKHVCAFCLRQYGATYRHTEQDCRKRKARDQRDSSKNEEL